ncbi:MAG TPA: BON domain-containing protein [Candidatus Limnocylindrales bacterium]|nr:BON domain-containing protein [Candidatus Limnocylindrales bacterium]
MKLLLVLGKGFLSVFLVFMLISYLVGGSGAEAREPAKDPDPAQTKTRPDWWLTFKTKMALLASPEVSAFDIDVDTKDGVIYLKGTVSSENEKQRAEQVAQGIEGKRGVVNNLVVSDKARPEYLSDKDENIRAAVEKNLASDPNFKNVQVDVKDGIVTLTGSVETYSLSAEAARLARVKGVKAIQNELIVEKEPS